MLHQLMGIICVRPAGALCGPFILRTSFRSRTSTSRVSAPTPHCVCWEVSRGTLGRTSDEIHPEILLVSHKKLPSTQKGIDAVVLLDNLRDLKLVRKMNGRHNEQADRHAAKPHHTTREKR